MPLIFKSSSCRPVIENVQYEYIWKSMSCLFKKNHKWKIVGFFFLLGLNLFFIWYELTFLLLVFLKMLISQRNIFFMDGRWISEVTHPLTLYGYSCSFIILSIHMDLALLMVTCYCCMPLGLVISHRIRAVARN